ncbi:MAG: response regulator [Asticcacaulis sp.]
MADEAPAHTPARIMIVEDNPDLAQTTGWLVEMLGYDYQLAGNAKETLDQVLSYKPDIMLMDIGLPGMDGYDLCRQLRTMPELSDTIFIAQTGWSESEHRQKAQEAGFHHHVVKPLHVETLEQLLNTVLS